MTTAIVMLVSCGGKTTLDDGDSFGNDGGSPHPVEPGAPGGGNGNGANGGATNSGNGNSPPGGSSGGSSSGNTTPPGGGSCETTFCPSLTGREPCCITSNGPCGEWFGGECLRPEEQPPMGKPPPPPSCNPGFCPSMGSAHGCCLTPNGPCGIDYGSGCQDLSQPPPSCNPDFCPPAGEGAPCCRPDRLCDQDVGYGCGFGSCMMPIQQCPEGPCPCFCTHCQCQWLDCLETEGCLDMMQCALATGCRGPDCYLSGVCMEVIDAFGGPGGAAASTALSLDACVNDSCRMQCGIPL